jgi:hypothetical protein
MGTIRNEMGNCLEFGRRDALAQISLDIATRARYKDTERIRLERTRCAPNQPDLSRRSRWLPQLYSHRQ